MLVLFQIGFLYAYCTPCYVVFRYFSINDLVITSTKCHIVWVSLSEPHTSKSTGMDDPFTKNGNLQNM